jgi:hypothetical protein
MYAVEPDETIHIYYERKEEPKPFVVLPLLCAVLCLLGLVAVTLYSSQHPYYEHERLLVPAHLLPPQTFTAQAQIIPTGVKTYPATVAYGVLTITNGSIIAQVIPAGITVQNVTTDKAVYVPPGNANGYGYATVSAHALVSGKDGNFATLAINQVIGSSVYIRNLSAFTGGQDAYSVKYATAQDKHTALLRAQGILLSKSSGLHYPCAESEMETKMKTEYVTWRCMFVSYHIPAFYHVTGVRLMGKNLIIDVFYVPRPVHVWVK